MLCCSFVAMWRSRANAAVALTGGPRHSPDFTGALLAGAGGDRPNVCRSRPGRREIRAHQYQARENGGLTEALALAAEAKRGGLRIMIDGMIGTSLGIAPALLVAQQAEIVDLDGPLPQQHPIKLLTDRAPSEYVSLLSAYSCSWWPPSVMR